jgi:glycosyltransferase involved in cell wall biosynthesis
VTQTGKTSIRRVRPKVAVFQRVIPHYRVGIFETVAASERYDYTFIYGQEKDDSFLKLPRGSDLPFSCRLSPIRSWRVWPTDIPMYYQPAEVAAALSDEFDVLIFNADFHILSYMLATLVGRAMGKKIIHWGHGVSIGGPRPELWWARRLMTELANAVLLYGQREADYYRRRGAKMSRIFVTHNALDTRPVRELKRTTTEDQLAGFRAANALSGRRVMIYTGRLLADKRLDFALRAMGRVLRVVPSAKLVIIGDGPEAPRLRRMVDELGLQDAVDMPGAIFDERELAKYYLSSHLAVSPGYVGLMVNQAFMYGVPVLTSDEIWLHSPEVAMVRPGRTGEFFRDLDEDDYARRAAAMLCDAPRLVRMGRQCLQLIDQQYNEKAMARVFDDAVAYALEH